MGENTILVTSSKGGTGKSSLASSLAVLAAMRGYRTLAVDMDPSAGLGFDLGTRRGPQDDDGAALLEALSNLTPLSPVKDVRPGLDVALGGTSTAGLHELAPQWDHKLGSRHLALAHCLAPIEDEYDLVVIDTAPGEVALSQTLALAAAQYVVIPARTDEASIDGIGGVAMSFRQVREVANPQLLAVVPFGVNPSATKVLAQMRARIQNNIPDNVLITGASIRYAEKAAVACREAGMVMVEYARDVAETAPKYWEAGGKDVDVAKSASKVAADYISVTSEILGQLRSAQAARRMEGVSVTYGEVNDA